MFLVVAAVNLFIGLFQPVADDEPWWQPKRGPVHVYNVARGRVLAARAHQGISWEKARRLLGKPSGVQWSFAALAGGGGRTTYTEVFGRFGIEAVEYEEGRDGYGVTRVRLTPLADLFPDSTFFRAVPIMPRVP
jgi:hypothetical protein